MRTTVGYAGGTTGDPTYRAMGDHSEVIRVEFDPQVVSFAALLDVFWESHDPGYEPWSRQYRHAVLTVSDDQRQQAEQSKRVIATKTGGPVRTAIEPAGRFYPAEAYHQKYLLRRAGQLFEEFRAMYPDDADLAASTAAARVNGYLGCHGDLETLQTEFGSLGLSPKLQQYLHAYLTTSCSRFAGLTCPSPR